MRAIRVPADDKQPVELIDVGPDWRDLAAAIGGQCEYIESFRCPLTPLYGLVGVTDEMGQYHDGAENVRAWPLYPVPGYMLKGDVLVLSTRRDPIEGDEFVTLYDDRDALLRVVNLIGGGVSRG